MYRFLVAFLVIVTTPQLLFAQKVPGYLGKRFSLEYNAFISPSFANPNSEDATPKSPEEKNNKQKGVSLNLQHHFMGQWVLSKRLSIIGCYGIVNTNYVPTLYADISFDKYPALTALNYQIGGRYFTEHYAPLGPYIEVRLGYVYLFTNDFTYTYLDDNSSSTPPFISEVRVKGTSIERPNVAVAFGTTRVFKNVITLSYGLDINIYGGGSSHHVSIMQTADAESLHVGDWEGNQHTLINMAAARYGWHCALNARFGIGILL